MFLRWLENASHNNQKIEDNNILACEMGKEFDFSNYEIKKKGTKKNFRQQWSTFCKQNLNFLQYRSKKSNSSSI